MFLFLLLYFIFLFIRKVVKVGRTLKETEGEVLSGLGRRPYI